MIQKIILTVKDKKWLLDNYDTVSRSEIAEKFGVDLIQLSQIHYKAKKREGMNEVYNTWHFILHNHERLSIEEMAERLGYSIEKVKEVAERIKKKHGGKVKEEKPLPQFSDTQKQFVIKNHTNGF